MNMNHVQDIFVLLKYIVSYMLVKTHHIKQHMISANKRISLKTKVLPPDTRHPPTHPNLQLIIISNNPYAAAIHYYFSSFLFFFLHFYIYFLKCDHCTRCTAYYLFYFMLSQFSISVQQKRVQDVNGFLYLNSKCRTLIGHKIHIQCVI